MYSQWSLNHKLTHITCAIVNGQICENCLQEQFHSFVHLSFSYIICKHHINVSNRCSQSFHILILRKWALAGINSKLPYSVGLPILVVENKTHDSSCLVKSGDLTRTLNTLTHAMHCHSTNDTYSLCDGLNWFVLLKSYKVQVKCNRCNVGTYITPNMIICDMTYYTS